MADNSYNVVYEYTEAAGGYKGVIFWTCYESKEVFQKKLAAEPEDVRKKAKVIAEGVSDTEAVRLTRTTPLECRVTSKIQDCTDPQTGEVNRNLLLHALESLVFAELASQNK